MNVRLEDHKNHLKELAALIAREEECALIIAPEDQEMVNDLKGQQKKIDEDFMVLVIGEFNAGKSTMINAMMGQDILPTGALPETGVITELRYGDKLKVTLIPKPNSGIPKPIVLQNPTSDEIKKYCSIDNSKLISDETDVSVEKKPTTENILYERTLVECNLPLLKEGIVLVDTVGLNDPWGNDYITERYFPKADAIIYLMNATTPYSKDDKKLLQDLNTIGLRNLIVAYTRFGDVRKNYKRRPVSELEEYMSVTRSHALKHTVLGPNAVHFIDSVDALDAKLDNDEELLVKSGMAGLEDYCNTYLAEEKGRVKVETLVGAIQYNGKQLIDRAEAVKQNAGKSRTDLKKQIQMAEEQLQEAELKRDTNVAKFKEKLENNAPVHEQMIRNHVETLMQEIDLDEYTLVNSLPRGFGKLNPFAQRSKAKAIAEECKGELERRLKQKNAQWITTVLQQKIEENVNSSVEEMSDEIKAFYDQLDAIDETLTKQQSGKNFKRNMTDLLAGVAYTVLTGDVINGPIAAMYGKAALGRAVASDILVGAGLSILAYSGMIISLPVAGMAFIIGNIIAVLLANPNNMEKKILRDSVAQFRKAYEEDKEGKEKTANAIIGLYNNKLQQASENYEK